MFQHTARKAGGTIILTTNQGEIHQDTKQCCHCDQHWVVRPGSGTIRGFCHICNDHHCGAKACHDCFPFEKRMDLYEKGRLVNSAGQPDLMGSIKI